MLISTYDTGGEFTGLEFRDLLQSYGIRQKPPTVKNPQANSFVERIHLTIGDHLRGNKFVHKEEWRGELHAILQSIAWTIRTTIHTVTNYSPAQLVFSKDMIVQMHINVDWQILKQKRLLAAKRNNDKENMSRIAYDYKVGDRILIVSSR